MVKQLIISFLFLTSVIIGQTSVQSSANISANLVKGLSTELINPTLDFGENILSGSASVVSRDPGNGIIIKVSGQPQKNVIINYTPIELTSQTGILQFSPEIRHTNGDPVYSNPVVVNNGSGFPLTNNNGEGILYVWIGGDIDIKNNQPAGVYNGTFLISVSY